MWRHHFFITALLACVTGLVLLAGGWLMHAWGEPEKARLASLVPGEEQPGGKATTRKTMNRDVFSHPSVGMGFENEANFKIGNAVFRRRWVSAPASTEASDGLGPLFNARACQDCHLKDGRGHPPAGDNPDDDAVSMILKLSIPPETDEQRQAIALGRLATAPEPIYGHQLQNFSIQGHVAEGRMRVLYTDLPVRLTDGTTIVLRKPAYQVDRLAHGALHPSVRLSPRIAPQMIGMGLLEAIPEADIRALADPEDVNQDGISGRARRVWSVEAGGLKLGRFGWKAGAPSIREQTANAFASDMGLSSVLVPQAAGDCTMSQFFCREAPDGDTARHGGVEVEPQLFDLTVFYAQNLAVPARRGHDQSEVLRGKALFHALGCPACHTPSHTTGTVPGQPHLSRQAIWPYTDLLLHDMGEGLSDDSPEGQSPETGANGREWRTPPLWGAGLTEVVSGHTFFLHDGRARNLEEAILWHDGESAASRAAYMALSRDEREALLAFLRSL